jgi:hypothetical protein
MIDCLGDEDVALGELQSPFPSKACFEASYHLRLSQEHIISALFQVV